MGAPAGELPSLGGSIALSFVSLGLVCLVAYVALRFLSRRGVGQGTGPLKVVARCPLEPRRSVYLIEAAGRCFLVGVGDGPMSLLAEVDPSAVKVDPAPAPGRFAEALARVLSRPAPPPRPPPAPATGEQG
jgi:flagellar biosynthetic protein FliO